MTIDLRLGRTKRFTKGQFLHQHACYIFGAELKVANSES